MTSKMNRRNFLKDSGLLSAGIALSPFLNSVTMNSLLENKISNSTLQKTGIKVIELNGSPLNRGQIHGEELRSQAIELIDMWKDSLEHLHQMNPDKYIDHFLEKTLFHEAVKKWAPELLEEVQGMANGTGIDFKTMFGFQVFEEERWHSRLKRFGKSQSSSAQCSTLGVIKQKDHPSIMGQNLDFSFKDGSEVVLHIKHQNSPLEEFAFSFAGFLGTTGMNNVPLGLCANSLLQLNPQTDGLPVSFLIRGVLGQSKYENAVQFIQKIKHATGQNYIIGTVDRIADFECSSNKVSRFIPPKEENRIYHTNHPLINDDLDKGLFTKSEVYAQLMVNSRIRLETLKTQLEDKSKEISVDDVKSILSSHDNPRNPICIHQSKKQGEFGFGNTHFTSGSLVMELSKKPKLHLAPGPPCHTDYEVFQFEK
ncbi:C45 family autoproteolytic acyltransferase/hydrolase [Acidobacteriota bacterium]